MKCMKYGGLKCPDCGAELEMYIGCDGMSDEAERYDERFNREWDWFVRLDCTNCPRVFPICRTPKEQYISEIIWED